MSLQTTLKEIATIYTELGAGTPDETLKGVYFNKLGVAFNQLALDLATESGWTAASGSATKGGFNTATVGVSVLAQSVKALIDALIAKGTLGP